MLFSNKIIYIYVSKLITIILDFDGKVKNSMLTKYNANIENT